MDPLSQFRLGLVQNQFFTLTLHSCVEVLQDRSIQFILELSISLDCFPRKGGVCLQHPSFWIASTRRLSFALFLGVALRIRVRSSLGFVLSQLSRYSTGSSSQKSLHLPFLLSFCTCGTFRWVPFLHFSGSLSSQSLRRYFITNRQEIQSNLADRSL